MGSDSSWFAHSPDSLGGRHLLREHLAAVSRFAGDFAEGFAWADEARLSGVLHDLGKYGDLFQARLRGEAKGVDHWSAGAWAALQKCRSVAAALAIQGHHLGLQQLGKDALRALNLTSLADSHPLGLHLSESRLDALLQCLTSDGLHTTPPAFPLVPPHIPGENHIGWMLDLRLLFSALVDADFIDTEAHFEGAAAGKRYRPVGPALEPERALPALERYRAAVRKDSKAEERVAQIREDLWRACVAASEDLPGLYTLSAPTGSGKTLAMLVFALRHAARHSLRRVVLVIPYLTIIEQTAAVYRQAFREGFSTAYVLERHSLAGGGSDGGEAEGARYWERLLAENWDAPIVITTSVQFLESLFSNRPSACRKLHRLAGSVILFDEVQTLPLPLAVPTLAALSHLSRRCRSTVVFATATQPAFDHLDTEVRKCVSSGWTPREIAARGLDLFRRLRRVDVRWPDPQAFTTWDDLCRELSQHDQILVVVNLKRHASDLARRLRDEWGTALFHLSTAMCPAHRQDVLGEVRRRLGEEERCLLVSTQCVEAGVDLSFRSAFRERFAVASTIQAGGRVNRHGEYDPEGGGIVYDFALDDVGITQHREAAVSADVLRGLMAGDELNRRKPADVVGKAMREELSARGGLGADPLLKAETARDYPTVKKRGRVIDADTRLVVVEEHLKRQIAERRPIDFQELLGGSVQLWVTKIEKLGLTALPGRGEIYAWNYAYERDFLGYMAGVLQLQRFLSDPEARIL